MLISNQQNQVRNSHRTKHTKQRQKPNNLASSSSNGIIDLNNVDLNDPFKNKSAVQRFRNEFGKYFVDNDSEKINK